MNKKFCRKILLHKNNEFFLLSCLPIILKSYIVPKFSAPTIFFLSKLQKEWFFTRHRLRLAFQWLKLKAECVCTTRNIEKNKNTLPLLCIIIRPVKQWKGMRSCLQDVYTIRNNRRSQKIPLFFSGHIHFESKWM